MKRSSPEIAAVLLLIPILGLAQAPSGDFFDTANRGNITPAVYKLGPQFGQESNQLASIIEAAYRETHGPGDTYPNKPPHLRQDQIRGLVYQMDALDAANKSISLNDREVKRLVEGLILTDIMYERQISAREWDSLIKLMGTTASTEYPKNHDWNTTIDDMLNTALEALKDGHTDYWNPQETKDMRDQMSGSDVGIGALVSLDPKGCKIDNVLPNSGAEAARLQSEDIVTAVNGKSLAGMELDDMIDLLKGPAGSQVSVTVLRGAQTLNSIVITRSQVHVPQLMAKMEPGTHIGYVYLSQFGDNSGDQVIANVRTLRSQGATALILDLRGNPGGIVDEVALMASEFLKDGQPIVTFKHQGQMSDEYITKGDGQFSKLPIVVLVDKKSASASEIMAAAMQDWRRGFTIVGTHSFGKGSEQELAPQLDNRTLHITINHNFRPNGQDIDANHDPKDGHEIYGTGGVKPDVLVPVDDKAESQILKNIYDEMFGRSPKNQAQDQALQKAIDILNKQGSTI